MKVRDKLMSVEQAHNFFGVALRVAIGIRLAVEVDIGEFDAAFHEFV